MKILNAEQIRKIDQLTIKRHKIASHELMEQAANQLAQYILTHFNYQNHFSIICGNGNNGGDGLALARILHYHGYYVSVYLTEFNNSYSQDNTINQNRLHDLGIPIHKIRKADQLANLPKTDIIIDALFGSGLNRPLEGDYAKLIDCINKKKQYIIAIDIPSGLFCDQSNGADNAIIKANITLSLQIPKWALFLAQNAPYIGHWELLDIGLNQKAIEEAKSQATLITSEKIQSIYRPREAFSHKGNHGHSLIIAGSYGKLGALILATKACLRSGSGLTSCYAPECAFIPIQSSLPSAMLHSDAHKRHISDIPEIEPYDSIVIGPGLGTEEDTFNAVSKLLNLARAEHKKLVIDADALNIMAMQPGLLNHLHENCILTPHPKEFSRLVGESKDNYEQLEKLRLFAKHRNCTVVLKGRYTCIADRTGHIYINNSGNAGLAKGGSGDTLSGIIVALMAQGYTPLDSALLGVYLHGLAADIATESISMESLIAEDISDYLSAAFRKFDIRL